MISRFQFPVWISPSRFPGPSTDSPAARHQAPHHTELFCDGNLRTVLKFNLLWMYYRIGFAPLGLSPMPLCLMSQPSIFRAAHGPCRADAWISRPPEPLRERMAKIIRLRVRTPGAQPPPPPHPGLGVVRSDRLLRREVLPPTDIS